MSGELLPARDESQDVARQIQSLIVEFRVHLEEDRQTREDIKEMKESLEKLTTLQVQMTGMGKLAKTILIAVAPVAGAVVFVKDHFKF